MIVLSAKYYERYQQRHTKWIHFDIKALLIEVREKITDNIPSQNLWKLLDLTALFFFPLSNGGKFESKRNLSIDILLFLEYFLTEFKDSGYFLSEQWLVAINITEQKSLLSLASEENSTHFKYQTVTSFSSLLILILVKKWNVLLH